MIRGSEIWPRWIDDLRRLLPIRSQFILSGNIRDVFLARTGDASQLTSLTSCLWQFMESLNFSFLLIYDRIDGIRVYPPEESLRVKAAKLLNIRLQDGVMPVTNLDSLGQIVRRVVDLRDVRVGFVIDFASRLSPNPQSPDSLEYKFYTAMEKLSLAAERLHVPGDSAVLFNPVIWLLNRAQDIPSWLSLDSERISVLTLSRPDFEARFDAALVLAPQFRGSSEVAEADRAAFAMRFADGCHGMSLQSMVDIAQLADEQDIHLNDIDDAVRCFKVGVMENPWKKDYLKEKIRNARLHIEDRVKGQKQATVKTVDILMRSVMALTGAQVRTKGGRPRGVLFFAGATGVGKTELAKTLTQLIFGDERAYIRFDMSEFAEEHAATRLLGAPPGYIGYAAGGELTNAVKERPFSVILFDEIEKCHPRVLDKFLQILEDGRLTDGQGVTVYFTEAVIIFTSNLGIYVEDDDGHRRQNVHPGDPYETVELKVRQAIEDHFKYRLLRPEILNRIGDNIVVFNFIGSMVALDILDGMLANVAQKVMEEHRVSLKLSPSAREKIADWCTRDLSNGGRGIGNSLESVLINPLARALFDFDFQGRDEVTVANVLEQDRVHTVVLV